MATHWSNIQNRIPSLNQLQTEPQGDPIIPHEPIRNFALHCIVNCVTLGIGAYVNTTKNGFSHSVQRFVNYGNLASLITLVVHFMYRHTKNMNQRIESIQHYTNRLKDKEFTIVELLGIPPQRYFFFKDKFEIASRGREYYETCTSPEYQFKFIPFHELIQRRPAQPS